MATPTGESVQAGARIDPSTMKVHLVGGGIASLAAAAFFIRDGDVLGHNITVYEELATIGGSLDGSGSAKDGYVLRGGRMFESKYVCTFTLFDSIPTLDATQTVTGEILQWNKTFKTSSAARQVRGGKRQTAPPFGLSERHNSRSVAMILGRWPTASCNQYGHEPPSIAIPAADDRAADDRGSLHLQRRHRTSS